MQCEQISFLKEQILFTKRKNDVVRYFLYILKCLPNNLSVVKFEIRISLQYESYATRRW